MKLFTPFCIVFFIFANALHIQAQKLIFEPISMSHGLSQHSVNAIIQDSTGFLWFATNDGLNRYNGYEFTIFKPIPGDAHSISGNKITALLQDSERKIWVGMTMGGGLNIFDPSTETFSQCVNENGDSNFTHSISDIFEDNQKNVWIASYGGGLHYYDRKNNTFTNYTHNPHDRTSIASNSVRAVCQDAYGTIWVGMNVDGGLQKFNPETKTFTSVPFLNYDIMSIHNDSYGQLWIGTYYGGFGILNPKTERYQTFTHTARLQNELSNNIVWSFFEDKTTQKMYVATRGGGLNIYNTQTHEFLETYQENESDFSIASNNILAVHKDKSGVLWVGTENNGLSRCNTQRKNFKILHAHNSAWLINIHSIIDEGNRMLIGTRGTGFHYIAKHSNNIRSFYSTNNSNKNYNSVNSMIYDPRGFYWIGTDGYGIFRFDAKTQQFEQFEYNADN
ncbi:MAG: hypothetical protein LBR55_07375, partial [Bacteroidales bacterium]|nr:hypothetical protein [Bacteroidales bacterium]